MSPLSDSHSKDKEIHKARELERLTKVPQIVHVRTKIKTLLFSQLRQHSTKNL